MNSQAKTCPKCGGRMALGVIAQKSGDGQFKLPHWIEGAAEVSIWTGLKTRGRRKLAVETYRCQRCCLLESYAPEG